MHNNRVTVDMIKSFQVDFKEAVKGLEQKYGCEISLGNVKYSDVNFTSSMKVTKRVNGKSAEQVEFERYCNLYGFNPSDYGRRIKSRQGESFVLIGFNPKARKYRYIARCTKTGNSYGFERVELI